MNPLTDAELQAYLDGLFQPQDGDAPAPDRADVERRLAAQPEARAALAAYSRVWAALAEEPPGFAPGFAERAAARVARRPARAEVPWPEYALLALVVAASLATAVWLRDALAASWLGPALPWLGLAAAALAAVEAADRLLLGRPRPA